MSSVGPGLGPIQSKRFSVCSRTTVDVVRVGVRV